MVRLVRKPSMWGGFFGRLAFCAVWAGMSFGFSWFLWFRRPPETPTFIYFVIGLFDLIALSMVWDIVVRFWRTLTNKQPQLDIDHQSLQPGSTAQVQFSEPHPESLAEIDVRLVALESVVIRNGATTTYTTQTAYDKELLRMNVDGPNPITRSFGIKIPADSVSEKVKWMIAVNTRLRQGGIMQHTYPIEVVSPAQSKL